MKRDESGPGADATELEGNLSVPENERIQEVTAQHLYDLRELTGFISGTELHDFFRAIADGEPSPSGTIIFKAKEIQNFPDQPREQKLIAHQAIALLNSPLWRVAPDIATYLGIRDKLSEDESLVDLREGAFHGTERGPLEGTVKAQLIYDLRELTGFMSGNDLHEFFREVLNEEPSPSGYQDIPLEKLVGSKLGQVAIREMNSPVWQKLQTIKNYVGR